MVHTVHNDFILQAVLQQKSGVEKKISVQYVKKKKKVQAGYSYSQCDGTYEPAFVLQDFV